MSQPKEFCHACGMKFTRPEQHALGDIYNEYCRDCAHGDGTLKSYAEVHSLIADDFQQGQGIERTAAEKMAAEIMAKLPAWMDS